MDREWTAAEADDPSPPVELPAGRFDGFEATGAVLALLEVRQTATTSALCAGREPHDIAGERRPFKGSGR